jgi:glycerate kinase
VDSYFGVLNNTAIIEMANCSGITMIDESQRNPLLTSSAGTGDMIIHVLDKG